MAIILLWFVLMGIAQTAGNEARFGLQSLENMIMSKINRTIPPYPGNDHSVNVSMVYTPFAVLGLDSANEVFSVSSLVHLSWNDDVLQWDPKDYSDHREIEINPGDIWNPKIVLSENIYNLQPVESKNKIVLSSSGHLVWTLSDVFHTRCPVDVSEFPFDIQRCKITFIPSWGYDITIHLQKTHVDTGIAPSNGEWTVEGMEAVVTKIDVNLEDFYAAQYTVIVRRKYLYYLINIIVPMTLLSILNPVVFLIPAGTGEKLTFLMSIFVSHAMFLTLIHQSMPPTSDAVSSMSIFLLVIELQGFLTILATVSVLCVHQKLTKETVFEGKSDCVKDPDEVTVKCRKSLKSCCNGLPLDRMMDRIFFVISLGLSFAGVIVWFIW